jgi:hypothetical protein
VLIHTLGHDSGEVLPQRGGAPPGSGLWEEGGLVAVGCVLDGDD